MLLTLKLQSLKLEKFEKWRVKNRVIRKTNTHEAEVQSSRENNQVSQCACAPSPKLEFRKMVSIYFLPDISEGLIFFLAYLSTRPKTLLSFRSCGSFEVQKYFKNQPLPRRWTEHPVKSKGENSPLRKGKIGKWNRELILTWDGRLVDSLSNTHIFKFQTCVGEREKREPRRPSSDIVLKEAKNDRVQSGGIKWKKKLAEGFD